VDGGIWANNPVAVAVVEAVSVLGWSKNEIDVPSIGCTEETIDFRQRSHSGFFWLRRGIDAALRGQSRSATGMARHLTGRDNGLDSVVRIDPPVAPKRFSLAKPSGIRELVGFGYAEARQALPRVKEVFFRTEAEPFHPSKI
jgi:uncharacterized protein